MATHTATVGSISHGTLRTIDLLRAFTFELSYLSGDYVALVNYADERHEAINVDSDNETSEDSELVNELIDALNELAPAYCYFGAHDGDGSDFGFWPLMDAIDELPRIKNEEGETLPDEDHCYVNDHGNVTVYGANGTVLLELV
jgi:hypothetical protein